LGFLDKEPILTPNLAKEHPELVQKLYNEELLPWLEKTGDPQFSG